MAPVKYSIIKRDIKSDKESAVNFDSIEVNADIAHKNYVLLFNEKRIDSFILLQKTVVILQVEVRSHISKRVLAVLGKEPFDHH